MEGHQWGGGGEEWGKKVQRIRSIIGRNKIDGGWVKNSVANGEAKELTCTIYGHELRREEYWRVGECRDKGGGRELGQL